MNHIYRTLWSVATQSWQAVPENARTGGKKSTSSAAGVVASVALGFALSGAAHAQSPPALPPAINQLPTGGSVARGTATFSQTATAQAAAMTVNQSSQRAVINWSSFNLGQSASVNFVQPNAQAVTLNRVNDSNPSQIFGRITANGQVFLSNANGVYFSPTSSVDVGAFTATTHSISDDNFMSGNYVFERKGSTGKITNEGNINAALGGYVALLAPEVQNAGVVVARAGTVAMAAGELITLNIDNNGSLAGITTTPSAIASLIENKLAVQAPDGQIILSAVGLSKLQTGVIKNSGSLEANSINSKGGKVYLEGDDITLSSISKIEAKGPTGGGTVLVGGDWQGSGDLRQATKVTMEAGATIDASATDTGDGGKVVLWSDIHNADSVTRFSGSIKAEAGPNGGDGGQVETSSHLLKIGGIQVSTKAPQGSAGKWLLDPYDVTISSAATSNETLSSNVYTPGANSSVINTGDLQTALGNGNVEVVTTGAGLQQGTINIISDISWSNSSTLTLTAAGFIYGTSGKTITIGTNGTLVLNPGLNGVFSANIAGSGNLKTAGPRTLRLTGTNTYTGTTTVSGLGWLMVGDAGTAGSIGTGEVIVNSGTYIDFARTGTNTYSNNISGSGGVYADYGGTNTLTGTLTYTGPTSMNASTIVIGNGGTVGTGIGAVNFTSNGKLKINLSNNFTISGAISSSGSLEQAGSGTTTLAYASGNTYTGGTTISAGTLKAGSATAFGTGAISVTSGAVLDLGGKTMTSTGALTLNGTGIGNSGALINSSATAATYAGLVTLGSDTLITGGSGTIALSNVGTISGTYALTLDGAAGGSIASIIGTDTGTLTKLGAGTWTLTGANTYSGTTTISAGTLQFGNGTTTTTTLGSGPIVDNATLKFNAASNQAFAPNTISGTGGLVVSGATTSPGTVTLRADNTFGGGVTINSGPRVIAGGSSSPGALTSGPLGTGTLTMADSSQFDLAGYQIGNTLKSTGTSTTAPVIYANSGGVSELTGQIDVTTTNSYFKLSPSAGNTLKLSGTLNNSLLSSTFYVLSQTGAGDVLSQFSAITNKYSFQLASTAGKWTIGSSLTGTKAGVNIASGVLDLAGYDLGTRGDSLNTTLAGGTLTNSALTTASIKTDGFNVTANSTVNTPAGTIDAGGVGYVYASGTTGISLTKTGAGDFHSRGSLIDTVTHLYDFDVNVSAGNLWYDAQYSAASFNVNYSLATGSTMYMNVAATVAGAISGGGSVVIKAATTLSGANTYTGGTTVLNGATVTLGRAAVMNGSTITSSAIGTGTLTLGDATTSGAVSLNGYALLPNNIVLNGTASISAGTATAAQVVSGTISDGINTGKSLTINDFSTGAGKSIEISGNNSYTGATTIATNTGDSVILSNSNALGVGSAGIVYDTGYADTLMLKGGITLSKSITMASGQSGTFGGLSGDNTLTGTITHANNTTTISNAAGTLTVAPTSGNAIDYGSGTLTFSGAGNVAVNGPVVGSGAITSSAGLLTLAGNNTFTGAMTVSSGVVRAASSTALGATSAGTTVANGATLELGGPASPSGIAIGAEALTLNSGALVHNVAGYNTYAGPLTLSGNATITVDTGTRLNFTATSPNVTYNSPNLLTLYTNGNLSFGQPLVGTGSYVKVGSGTLTLAAGTTITGKVGVYAGLYDPTGTDYSSVYGSAPDLTVALFDSTSGGNKINLTAGTDYSGTINWTGTVPTASSNVNTYALTYASGLTLSNTGYVLMGAASAANWRVIPKPITVSLNAPSSSYTYNGVLTYANIAAGLTAFSVTQMVGSDSVASISSSASASGVAQAGSFTLTPSNATIGTGLASNYSFSYSPLTVAIGKANLSKVIAAKAYDGLSTVTAAQMTAIEGVNGETFFASVGTASISDKNVAGTKTLTDLSGLTVSGTNGGVLGNYFWSTGLPLAGSNNQVTISAKALTVTAPTVSKEYDGTTSATGTASVGALGTGDVVNAAASLSFTDKNVGAANKTVHASGVTIKDASNADMTGNYVITYTDNTASTITPKALTVSGTTVASKTYDGTNATTLSGGSLAGVISGDNVTLTQAGAFVSANAGTGVSVTAADSLGGSGAGNYTLTQPTGLSANIDKAPLTVTAADAAKNFGSANPSFSVTVSGYIPGETAATSGVTGTGLATTTATDLTVAGTAPITASVGTLAAANYAFTRFVDGTLTIKPISAMNNTEVTTLIGAQLSNLTGSQVGSFSTTQLQVFSPQQLGALSPSQLAGLTNAQLLSLSPDQIAAISPARIASMTPDQLAGFSVSQVAGLTTSQLQALSAAQFSSLSNAQLQALSSSQVTAITADQLSVLTSSQIALLTSNAAASLSFQQIAALAPGQIVGVDSVRVASLTAAEIGALSIPQLQALSLLQLAAISPANLSSLTSQQIAGLTSNAAASLSFQQIAALAPTQIVGVDAVRVASLTAAEIGSLSDAQLQALSLLQIAAIAPDHFSALSPAQIMAMSITQVINLTPDQLRGFSPAQVASLSAAELAYFDARQLAAIGIVPKTEAPVAQAPVAQAPVPTPVAAPSVEAPVPPAIATSNQLPLNFETPNAPVEQVAVSAASTTSTVSPASDADANDARNKFQAAIPVMTAVAGANATAAVPAAAPTPITAAPVTTTVSTAVTATTTATPTAPAAGVAQSLPSVTLTAAAPQTGVLVITILSNAEPKPTTTGVAFEQDGNSVTFRTASAPPTPPASDKLTFNDKLTTFMVSSESGGLIEFKASLVNRRLVILAQSTAARQIARTEMNVVLAAAITSLGAENRVMLANLDGVVLDLR